MSHVVRDTGTEGLIEIPPLSSFQGADGALHPWQVAELWADTELAEIGVYRAAPVVVPEGGVLVSYTFERDRTGAVVCVGVFEEPPQPPYEPITVSASSAKLVLDDDGIYTQVETICRNHPVNAVRIFWESAKDWVENDPYVAAIGAELGLADEQQHDMFVRAQLKDRVS